MLKLKSIIEAGTGLKLQELPQNAKHEVGKVYYCGYWHQTYEVLALNENTGDWRGWEVTCKWQDGHTNEHCTSLTPGKDFLVIQ
jgi:hypothetical protein